MPRTLVSRTITASISLVLAAAPVPALASEQPVASTDPTSDVPQGPVVHIINDLPDDERGPIKLARSRLSFTQVADGTVTASGLWELCTEPCNVRVDVSERPIFFFVRDGVPVSDTFRIPDQDEVTLRVRPRRMGMMNSGMVMTGFMLLPIGIPLWVLGRPKVQAASGAPATGQRFRRAKRAKL